MRSQSLGATHAPPPRLLVDTFAAGLVSFLLALQWRWYISVRRDVKLCKKNLLLGVLDRAVLREVDISEFALLGRDKKPEAPKVRSARASAQASDTLPRAAVRPQARQTGCHWPARRCACAVGRRARQEGAWVGRLRSTLTAHERANNADAPTAVRSWSRRPAGSTPRLCLTTRSGA